jgi:hypothetical protein
MNQVQASIQLLVDYHVHDGGTAMLAAMTDAERKAFLEKCTADLQGGDVAKFLSLCSSGAFKPLIDLDPVTGEPTLAVIHAALAAAVAAYNVSGFGLQFAISDPHASGSATAVPNYACVQWVWINGEWVKRYNYDLTVTTAGATLHTSGGLTASYRVTLGYSTVTTVVAGTTTELKLNEATVVPHRHELAHELLKTHK